MLPKFEWLYAFVVLSEELHFMKAAERLQITQQALGKSLFQLEKAIGYALLERSPLRLTSEGLLFFQQTQAVLKELETLEGYYRQPQILKEHLRVGCLGFVPDLLLHKLTRFLKTYTECSFEICIFNEETLLQSALLSQEIDLAISLPSFGHLFFSSQPLLRSEWLLVALPNSTEYLNNQGHLLTPGAMSTWAAFPALYHLREGFKVFSDIEVSQLPEWALAGAGAAWIPRCLIEDALQQKTLCQISGSRVLPFVFHLYWPTAQTQYLTPLLRYLQPESKT